MSVVMARIDNRLLHGIIVTQWAPVSGATRVMVIDDKVAGDEVLKSTMRMARPAGMAVSIISEQTALKNFAAGKYDREKVFVIAKEPETMLRLVESGVDLPSLVVGGSLVKEDGIQLTVNGGATVKIVDNSKGFIDTQDHWAKDAIDFVSARGLVNGMSATIYAPNASTTRAQLWTILARQNDADLNGGATWFENAQNWAKTKGISDGANPNAAINRAQMVTMLWRAVGQPAPATAATFTDVSADAYYAGAVSWAVENGITTGVGGGHFDPTATCTRAQIAAFLARSMK